MTREFQLKAVFLYNFTQFVDWPPEVFPTKEAPFVIGVLGENPFGGILEEIVRDEKVNGRDLVVAHFRRAEDVKSCHILFIHAPNQDLSSWLPLWRGRRMLLVSDALGFARNGGTIGFSTVERKIRLIVNLKMAKESGLSIRSQLLRAVELVDVGRGVP